jgi:glycosyltransferase involved in cell wall biosynthesis
VRGVRIVYLNPAAELGGAERCLLDMMGAVRETGPSLELHLVVSADGPLIARAERLGVQVTILPMPNALVEMGECMLNAPRRGRAILELGRRSVKASWAAWRYATALSDTLKRVKPDIIHSNGIKFHMLAGMARLPHAPVVWHIHDFLSLRPLITRALRWASRRARGAIAVSRAVLLDAQAVLPRLPIELIYNAIDTDEFSPGPVPGDSLDRLAGLPEAKPNTIRIGLVATFARWKGHEVFLKAATHLMERRLQPDARFFIIGGPIYQTSGSQFSARELRTFAAERGIDAHVGFIPFQRNPADVYRALDIVVHASTQPEPFGRTIVEAMACARPVIVSQTGGAAELFTHGRDALGVPPNDPAPLASALGDLIVDIGRRECLGRNARPAVLEHFSRQRLGPQILGAYNRFLRASRAA